jgi:hypothetical protein
LSDILYYVSMKTNEIISQCQFCGSIQKEDGSYDGIKRELFQNGHVSHGACPTCFEIEMTKIEAM